MNSRFEELYKTKEQIIFNNSPIVLEAYAIYKDITDGRILCQVRFKNIGTQIIKACKIAIDEFEIDDTFKNLTTEFSFLDLICGTNKTFGSKTAIYLNSKYTRKIKIRLINIVLDNYDVVDLKDSIADNIMEQKEYLDYYSKEQAKVFKEELGDSVKYVPVKTKNYLLCTCGTVNSLQAKFCSNCSLDLNRLIEVSKTEFLDNELKLRIKEKERRELEKIEREKRIIKREQELEEMVKKEHEKKGKERKFVTRIADWMLVFLIILSIVLYFINK